MLVIFSTPPPRRSRRRPLQTFALLWRAPACSNQHILNRRSQEQTGDKRGSTVVTRFTNGGTGVARERWQSWSSTALAYRCVEQVEGDIERAIATCCHGRPVKLPRGETTAGCASAQSRATRFPTCAQSPTRTHPRSPSPCLPASSAGPRDRHCGVPLFDAPSKVDDVRVARATRSGGAKPLTHVQCLSPAFRTLG